MVCEVSIETDLVVEGWATLGYDVAVGPAVTAMLGLVISEYHFTHVISPSQTRLLASLATSGERCSTLVVVRPASRKTFSSHPM